MADFKIAFLRTMGFEDDPRHPGAVSPEPHGARARLGINSLGNPDLPDYFWTCPYEEAMEYAEKVFRARYWEPLKLDSVTSQDVANKIYDIAVNQGVWNAAKMAQRASGAFEDGTVGPATLNEINLGDPGQIVERLKEFAKKRHRDLAAAHPEIYGQYLNAWLARDEK